MQHKKRSVSLTALALAVCLLAAVFAGCGRTAEYADAVFTGMDTVITLRLASADIPPEKLSDAVGQCRTIVEEMEQMLSFHDPTSELYSLNRDVQMVLNTDPALLEILESAVHLSSLTGGAYNPSIGALTGLWNVNGGGPVPDEEEIEMAMMHSDPATLQTEGSSVIKNDPALQFDLGGYGKGYTLQKLLDYLYTTGIPYGLVSMGGNIGVFGQKPDETPYQIGITDPANTDGVLGYMYISSGFVSVSGSYERYFVEDSKRYHHILDPSTGYPADSGLSSVVCYTQNGAAADALSTALFVLGAEKGMELYASGEIQFEAVFITEDNRIFCTDGITEKGMFQKTAEAYTLETEVPAE